MKQPNILFIFTDQQSANMMSCAGNTDLQTPAMDSLAARGTRFERAYCANPLCVPSRGVMSTGLYPHQTGITINYGFRKEPKQAVSSTWMGAILRDGGYRTAYRGKWHQPIAPSRVETHGFELPRDEMWDPEIPDLSAAFFQEKHSKPFLFVVSISNPHRICEAARDLALPIPNRKELLKDNLGLLPEPEACPILPPNFEIPEGEPDVLRLIQRTHPKQHPTLGWNEERWRQYRWCYARFTEKADALVGSILKDLRASGLEKNTVVIFSSDHGDGNGAHRWNQKTCLYEEAVRVPFIIADLRDDVRGAVDDSHLVNTGLDLIPTMCDYAGIKAPAGLTGLSLRPLLENRSHDWRDHLVIETEFNPGGRPRSQPTSEVAGRALITKKFKYVVYSHGNAPEQLTDLEMDPGEMRNLVGKPDYENVLNEHRRLFKDWQRNTADTFEQRQSYAGTFLEV